MELDVGMVNESQRQAWDGPEGDSWTENEEWHNNAYRFLTPPLLDAASIGPDEHVLDVGCGCGETTRLAARSAKDGWALGVDLSARMIARARERARAEGVSNARFEQADAQTHPFDGASIDVVISRTGTMFFDDPVAAFTNLARALVPHGRLVMNVWRGLARNEWLTELRRALAAGRDLPEPPPDAPGAVALADPSRLRGVLEASGFTQVSLEPHDEPLFMGPDAVKAYEAVRKLGTIAGLIADLDERQTASALDELRSMLTRHETADGVLLGTSSWLVRATVAR